MDFLVIGICNCIYTIILKFRFLQFSIAALRNREAEKAGKKTNVRINMEYNLAEMKEEDFWLKRRYRGSKLGSRGEERRKETKYWEKCGVKRGPLEILYSENFLEIFTLSWGIFLYISGFDMLIFGCGFGCLCLWGIMFYSFLVMSCWFGNM